jgi:hypothetical protein
MIAPVRGNARREEAGIGLCADNGRPVLAVAESVAGFTTVPLTSKN